MGYIEEITGTGSEILKLLLYPLTGMAAGAILGLLIELCLGILGRNKRNSWIKLVPYTVLVRETIRYTGNILAERKIAHYPEFRIRYYGHSQWSGVFDGNVVVYIKNKSGIREIVNTTLHEVMHYIQSCKSKQYKYYDHLTKVHGYLNNPLEVEARAFASEYCDPCLNYLESKKLIKKI